MAPADDDERFIVGLVLSYYRRHPERARARLLDLLGEALQPPRHRRRPDGAAATRRGARATTRELWSKAAAAVAPLKRKR